MAGNTAGPIVVGVDGSGSALHAVRWAAEEAVRRRRVLRLVHALDDGSLRHPQPLPTHTDITDITGMFRSRGQRPADVVAARPAHRDRRAVPGILRQPP